MATSEIRSAVYRSRSITARARSRSYGPRPTESHAVMIFGHFVGAVRFLFRWLEVLGHGNLFGPIPADPFVPKAEPDEMPEDLQFLRPGPRATGSDAAEVGQVLELDFMDVLAALERRPAWKVVETSIGLYIEQLPPDDRRMVEAFAKRVGTEHGVI